MSTATVTDLPPRQLKFPRFDGLQVPQARLSFGGALELALTNAEDIALVEALGLGAELTVTLKVDGLDRELTLGARCVGRSHKFRKKEESDSVVGVHRIVINDVRAGDEPEDGE